MALHHSSSSALMRHISHVAHATPAATYGGGSVDKVIIPSQTVQTKHLSLSIITLLRG